MYALSRPFLNCITVKGKNAFSYMVLVQDGWSLRAQ